MAITIPTLADLEESVMAYIRNRFPTRATDPESFLGKWGRAIAMAIWQLHKAVADADADAVPSTSTSSAALDRWAEVFGLYSGTVGVYGRKGATAAQGISVTITGTAGTVVANGTQAVASDGVTTFELNGPVTISGTAPGSGSVSATIDAVTTGTVGNLAVWDTVTWQSPAAGTDDTATVMAVATTLGIDRESDADLLARILDRLQTPPKGGTGQDFRNWAEEVSGVARAYSYPLRGGNGTCHVVITGSGSGSARIPTVTVELAVENYITGTSALEGKRSVTAQGFDCILPSAVNLLVRCRVTPALGIYAFDWIDTAVAYSVDAYDGTTTPATLTLNTTAPASLKSAITAGLQPRLQVACTTAGALAVNPEVRCTAWTDIAGPKTRLTLENPLPDGWTAPTVTDAVYAGGPGVATARAAIFAYIDSLGPSRVSGYADQFDSWESTCAIARLTQLCLNAADTDETRFYSNIVSGGITINGADVDLAATDTGTPQLLVAQRILVTQ